MGSQFVVTKQNGGGFALNIFSVSIGPTSSAERDVVQQVCIAFDLPKAAGTGKPADANNAQAAKCPSAPGSGNQSGSGSAQQSSG